MKPLDPRLVRRSRAVRHFLVLCVVVGALTSVALVVQAWFVADLVSGLFAGQAITAVAVAVAATLVLRGALAWLHATASSRAAVGVKTGLRHELLEALLDPSRVGGQPSSTRFATLLGSGLDRLDGYIGRFLPHLVLTVIVPIVVVVALLVADPLSALIVVLTLPIVLTFLVLVGLVTRDRLDRRWGELVRLGRHFSDVLDGLTLLKIFGRSQEQGLREVGERHQRATMESLRTAFLSSLVLELFSTLSVAIVAVTTGLRIVEGHLDLHTGLFVLLLAPEAYTPLRRLGLHYHDSTDGVVAANEALDLLDHGRRSGSAKPPRGAEIVLDGVEVTYPDRAAPALRIDREVIAPGEFVAVTGPSGSGKSTLLAALLGFVAPTVGHVSVGGVDLEDLDIEAWRARVAWVPQFPGLLAASVADNVRLGDPSASDSAVYDALRDAGARDLHLARQVGEGGADLSAGERRRVGIARALLRVRTGAAELLLMDEPTAGLDAYRESHVLGVLCDLPVTIVVVAHRAETVAAARRVITIGSPAMVR